MFQNGTWYKTVFFALYLLLISPPCNTTYLLLISPPCTRILLKMTTAESRLLSEIYEPSGQIHVNHVLAYS